MICTCIITKCALLTECQPIQFWIISRHGTRYTDVDGINEMWSLTDVRHQIVSNHKHGRKYHYNILFREQIHNIKPCDVRNYELSNPQTFGNEVPVSWKLSSFPETFILSLFIRTHNTLYATCPSQLVFSTFFQTWGHFHTFLFQYAGHFIYFQFACTSPHVSQYNTS
jgi:hypothetical protein